MRAPLRLSRITILAAVVGLALVIGCMRAMNQPAGQAEPAGQAAAATPPTADAAPEVSPGAPESVSSPAPSAETAAPDGATFSHMVEPLTARLFTIPENARTPVLTADRLEPAATAVAQKPQPAPPADMAALAPATTQPAGLRPQVPEAPPSPAPAPAPAETQAPSPAKTVLVVGDSFAVGIGMTLAETLKPAKDVRLDQKGKTSSGLDNSKFHNWGKTLEGLLQGARPAALVVMVGGNDANNGPGTEIWAESYRHKAADFLGIAAKKGVPVFWVALPPMRDEDLNARVKTTNAAMRAACESGGNCRFIDAWDLFTDEKGRFAAEKTIDGKVVKLRAKDGVHFTMAGYRLLSDRILAGFAPNLELSLKK